MSHEVLGLVALGVLFAAIFVGFPIAFTLGAVALGTGWIALGPVVYDLAVLQTYSVMKDTVLAAIPFFLFMGFLLEQSGIMERLFNGIQQLLAAGKVSARPIDLGPITQTTRLRTALLLPAGVEAVGMARGEITVTVQVDVLRGSQQYTVPVEAEGAPPGLRAVVSPATVIVVLRGDRPVLDKLSAADLKAVVIARRLAAGVHRMPVNLRLPPGLERVSVAPDPIELTLVPAARPPR